MKSQKQWGCTWTGSDQHNTGCSQTSCQFSDSGLTGSSQKRPPLQSCSFGGGSRAKAPEAVHTQKGNPPELTRPLQQGLSTSAVACSLLSIHCSARLYTVSNFHNVPAHSHCCTAAATSSAASAECVVDGRACLHDCICLLPDQDLTGHSCLCSCAQRLSVDLSRCGDSKNSAGSRTSTLG